MTGRQLCASLLSIPFASAAVGQEATSSISVPITISGNARYTDPTEDSPASVGFRALFAPQLQLGQHWFGYSLLGGESSKYWPYTTGVDEAPVRFDPLQAYVGYEQQLGSASILIKGGRLSSAFGHFPLEYDDAKTALIEPPSIFTADLPLRPDQLPCGVHDVIRQHYDEPIEFSCGGTTVERYGLVPVTLYGIPGIERSFPGIG